MSSKTCSDTDTIEIIPFEPRFQEDVVKLFKLGLSAKTYDLGKTVIEQQKWFVQSKLSKHEGDMFDIWESFMKQNVDKDPITSLCKHFWVAVDQSKQQVVGHIGVIMSTYPKEDQIVYHMEDLNPENVCELVRMGVDKDYRGRNIGKRLFKTLEDYASRKGMKQIVLSTLDRMTLARKFYEGIGFKLFRETRVPIKEHLGPGDWENLYVVHYLKSIEKRW